MGIMILIVISTMTVFDPRPNAAVPSREHSVVTMQQFGSERACNTAKKLITQSSGNPRLVVLCTPKE